MIASIVVIFPHHTMAQNNSLSLFAPWLSALWGRKQTVAPLPFAPEQWREVIWAITNVFETGRAEGDASAIQTHDAGIVSYGKHQATLASGTLAEVVICYVQTSQTPVAAELTGWLPRLEAKDPTLRQETSLHQLLRSAAADPAMIAAQDSVFETLYYQPAINRAIEHGLGTPLALACLYDAGVQGGRDHILARLAATTGVPSPLPEQQWIALFLDQRDLWLGEIATQLEARGEAQQAHYLRNSRFRVAALRQLLWKNNLNLRGRIRLRGQIIQGLP